MSIKFFEDVVSTAAIPANYIPGTGRGQQSDTTPPAAPKNLTIK